MDAVIIAGGLGARLAAVTGGLPKALVQVGGKPLLQHQIELVARYGGKRVFVLTGHRGEAIADFCGDGARWNMAIECIKETRPLGTAGAVLDALDRLPERFAVFYGDTMVAVDLARLADAHRRAGADATLLLHPNDHPEDSDLVETDQHGRIVAFHPYPHRPDALLPNLVNAALYVLERESLRGLASGEGPLDFGKHVFAEMLRRGRILHGYRSPEYIKDAGTPERLEQVANDVASGVVDGMSLNSPRRAVLLDRDGTLNVHVGLVKSPEQLSVIPGAADALRALRRAGYRLAVVTNQPVVARGDCSEEELARIHNKLEKELGRGKAYLDGIFYCPHHPDAGFAGERPELKIRCDCRKPGTGLIARATEDLNLDLGQSWFIGDSTVDVELARRTGLPSILVETGEGGRDGRFLAAPDIVLPSIAEAADFILREAPALELRLEGLLASIVPGDMVLIGGQAHVGKSTVAGMARILLARRGLDAVVIPLDSWIRTGSNRPQSASFLERHDIVGAATAIAEMRSTPGRHSFGRFDPLSRVVLPLAMEVILSQNSVIIVEGVSALCNESLVRDAKLKIAVTCNEIERRERFRRRYEQAGFSETDIARIMQDREQDEMPYVEAAQRSADAIFDSGLPPVGPAIATPELNPSSPETHNVAVQRRDRPGIDGGKRSNG